jgi:hypothetical protein
VCGGQDYTCHSLVRWYLVSLEFILFRCTHPPGMVDIKFETITQSIPLSLQGQTGRRRNFCALANTSALCSLLFVVKKSSIEFCHLARIKNFRAYPRQDYHTSPMGRIPVPASEKPD